MMHHISLQYCTENVFPFIHTYLTKEEAAPLYEREENGMQELHKILTFVQNDEYYPDFYIKAAYLICSIAGSQHFSNGNKRLGVGILLSFLLLNDTTTLFIDKNEYEEIFTKFFPEAKWEHNTSIGAGHALFLYNLAIIIGDSRRRSSHFDEMKWHVMNLFAFLYKIS